MRGLATGRQHAGTFDVGTVCTMSRCNDVFNVIVDSTTALSLENSISGATVFNDTPHQQRFHMTKRSHHGLMTRNAVGRPSKGDRDAFTTKPARPLGNAIRERAIASGMTYGDYIASILARELGMPEYAPGDLTMQELPITA
ncbi:hypothetical protein [Plantibacter sp. CFBP 8775]|uniref:hypothetical protein n=1 Tax=Plantibacter sp. CFBP 8775 TaxID=2774038 RepID=UPI00177D92EA|nr:hypothetical protein [Plantibacter sp. CFBP 8775]MBD8104795.1 hypothetical protein [Plantibacter sp. CFBP 8775]